MNLWAWISKIQGRRERLALKNRVITSMGAIPEQNVLLIANNKFP